MAARDSKQWGKTLPAVTSWAMAIVIVGVPPQPVSHDGVVRSSLRLSSNPWVIYIILDYVARISFLQECNYVWAPYYLPPGVDVMYIPWGQNHTGGVYSHPIAYGPSLWRHVHSKKWHWSSCYIFLRCREYLLYNYRLMQQCLAP